MLGSAKDEAVLDRCHAKVVNCHVPAECDQAYECAFRQTSQTFQQ